MLSGHSATQEIKHLLKYTSGFIGHKSSIMREVSVYPGTPKQSCSTLQNFSWRPCKESGITKNTMDSSMG